MKKTISLILVLSLGLIASVAKADFILGEPTNLGPTVNSWAYDESPSISADGLSLYFCSILPGGYGGFDIWMTTRATKADEWGEPVNLGARVNSGSRDQAPCISANGLELYFASNRGYGYITFDIWKTTRETIEDDWGEPVKLGSTVNSSAFDYATSITADGLSLFFGSNRGGGSGGADLWVTTRETTGDAWVTPVNLGPTVNSSAHDGYPSISADGRTLFFSGWGMAPYRPDGFGESDLWMTRRATPDDPWRVPVNLGATVNSSGNDGSPNISADGSTLYFLSDRPGGSGGLDLWQASIEPVVDLNADGIVDIDDLVIMIDNWGTDKSMWCDIGPMPWGDGIVDREDVEVLMSYWGQEIEIAGLIAHWNLDETEGAMAHDSIGNIKAELYGDPVWRPTDGMVDGALMLDGIDDFVGTWYIPNLSDGYLSVFAWIKGGAPGQVVVSQFHGVNWLMADASQGYLKTDLNEAGPTAQSLASEVTITDGEWHHVGITWDGLNRILYVDDVAVASDTRNSLDRSTMGLNIGCGPNETSGTFFSGLIDDIRIYNRAVKP